MGKGDKRTRRGKIFAGSFGKSRPKYKKPQFAAAEEKPAKKTKGK
jgi:30S ribosomal protein S31